jgi:murein DD-endopeptidase MepM/ murein hydrolase activator NlpD
MSRIYLILFFLCLFSFIKADNLPKDYFNWPVKHTIRLSGTFGELRSNHFHGGLDIKSEYGATGDKLYSAGAGYIYKISVKPNGYGNALYIKHPNGFTTVYGHMNSFSDSVEDYVKAQQYDQERFSQVIELEPDMFPVDKGDFIGKMGNSGSSRGAHLHFEVRETASNKQMNPLLFGLSVQDVVAPILYTLKLYEFDEDNKVVSSKAIKLSKTKTGYRINGDTLYTESMFWGLALKAYDRHSESHNKNGVYAMQMDLDGKRHFSFSLDAIPVKDSRYLNAHLDYKEWLFKRSYYNRLFKLPGNKLDMYKGAAGDGFVRNLNQVRAVVIEVADINGNTSTLEFFVKETVKKIKPKAELHNYYLFHNHPNLIVRDDFEVYFPENSLYLDELVHIDLVSDRSAGYYSDVLKLHSKLVPLHRPINIALRIKDPSLLSDKDRSRLFIGHCDKNGRVRRVGGDLEGDFVKATVWGFGDYAIFMDTIKPKIRSIGFRYDSRRLSKFRFVIDDNIPLTRSAGVLSFRGEVDGQWILFSYDQKYKTITHQFDGTIKPGKHKLRLVVEDLSGNIATFEKEFIK